MTPAARTIIAFAIYMALTGVILLLVPNTLLGMVGLPLTDEIWLRVLGMFMIIVAYYYYGAAVSEATAFFLATVHGRTTMAVFLIALAVTGMSSGVLALFGLAELVGAIATGVALRSSPAKL